MESGFNVSWTALWRIFLFVAIATALFLVRDVILILLFAIVISSALEGPVNFFEKKKIPRLLSTIMLFIVFLGVFAFLLYTIVPVSIVELENFLHTLNQKEIPILGQIDTQPLIQKLNTNLGDFINILFSGGTSFINIIGGIFGNFALILVTLILSFYLTVDRAGVEKFLRAVLPLTHEEYIIDIYLRTRKKMGLWLRAQILIMITVGILSFVGLLILGVKYSLILGILAGLLEIVPIAGPIFAGALAFIAAVPISWELGIYVLILFFIIQQLENHILYPVIMKKTVGISPIVVVLFLLAGSKIAGIAGIVLAVPVAVAFQEIIADWERKKLKSAKQEKLTL